MLDTRGSAVFQAESASSLATPVEVTPPPPPADLISHRAELFRSRLIEHFRLLDAGIDEDGKLEASTVTSHQLVDASEEVFQRALTDTPYGLVSFSMLSPLDLEKQLKAQNTDKRMMRLEYRLGRKIVPMIRIGAGKILRSRFFDGFILALVILNSLTLGVQAEFRTNFRNGTEVPSNEMLNTYLDYFDRMCLVMFVVEILLKWIDNFMDFWLSGWNIFDFVVTLLSVVPELMRAFAKEARTTSMHSYFKVVNNIRIFRIFRSLKTVTRIEKVRLLVSAIINAFTAMVFITILLGVFLYIFAIFGVIVFRGPTDELEDETGKEWNRFGNMWAAMATLFQIFTLDNWLNIARQMAKTGGSLTYFYVILWILIGSFIFNNIFVGIMVNNFQNIRNQLFREVKEIEQTHRIAQETIATIESATDGLAVEDRTHSSVDPSGQPKLWERTVSNNLELLQRRSQETVWPKDTLFQFFLLMEALQENMEERMELLMLAKDALATLQDD
ncbi:cation channel sperm-associated protein 2-like [Pollicipes pollicipes]|uniref:cation channel sperm-associated protein 2-like n=1 Tax=Pollicipes pollicipes TaxID=41117 RepID=UPI00188524DE|nr:cation channel sperm-associated protein 2-like [Pollicipes pollicipes]